jgi:type IV secretory pathway TrbF-like protein
VTTREAIALLDAQPDLAAINAHLSHKSHNIRSVELDASVKRVALDRRDAEDAEVAEKE